MTEDEMVGWHHGFNGHEFEQALGVGDGQGGLACCSPWSHKKLDTTEWLNWGWLGANEWKSLSKADPSCPAGESIVMLELEINFNILCLLIMRNYPEIFTHWRPSRDSVVECLLFVQENFIHGTHYWIVVWRTLFGKCGFVYSFSLFLIQPEFIFLLVCPGSCPLVHLSSSSHGATDGLKFSFFWRDRFHVLSVIESQHLVQHVLAAKSLLWLSPLSLPPALLNCGCLSSFRQQSCATMIDCFHSPDHFLFLSFLRLRASLLVPEMGWPTESRRNDSQFLLCWPVVTVPFTCQVKIQASMS